MVDLETDLNQEYIIKDLIDLQKIIDQHSTFKQTGRQNSGDAQQQLQQVFDHQYDLLGARMRLKYNGKSLEQFLQECWAKNLNMTKTMKMVRK